MTGVGAIHIQKFLLACSEQYPPSTIHNVRLYLKKLYAFLYATGRVDDNYSVLFSFSVNREIPNLLQSVLSWTTPLTVI